jgi:hypothetical protein
VRQHLISTVGVNIVDGNRRFDVERQDGQPLLQLLTYRNQGRS